jgi:asparagine synthase (glutamine-hydrolysing)
LTGNPSSRGLIEKMTGAMAHRGPDGINHWVNGSVALGQCMLRTTPESLEEHQPLTNEDESLVLVMDGRVDNWEELRRELLGRGAVLRNRADAELVLRAYEVWGEDSPKHLLGDFSYAVWDKRHQGLFCSVDHIGARPFYCAGNQLFFAFASEEEVLTELPGVSRKPNEAMILHLLVPAFQSADNQRFWLRDVGGLQPGQSIMVFRDGSSRTKNYWQLEPGEECSYASEQECVESFLNVFGEAVRCRMRGTGHIAAMISGGMDSASIAAMIKRLLPRMPGKEFHTYSAVADDSTRCVESHCIKSLTQNVGSHAHFVSVPSFQGMVNEKDLIKTAWFKPHPCDNSILLPAMMCLAASYQDHHVLLHGVSGDITMHVPDRYIAHLLRAGQWRAAWDECRGASQNNTFLHGSEPVSLLFLNIWTAYMPGAIKILARRLRRGTPLAPIVINPKFAQRLQLRDRLRAQEAEAMQPFTENVRQAHARVLTAAWGLVLGLTGYERVSGRYGVELRDPWADKRVIEFFLHLPFSYKVRRGWTKYLAREAFSADLEPHICWRLGKEHLGWQFVGRLMDITCGFVSQTMEQSLAVVEDYVDVNALRVRYERFQSSGGVQERQFFYDIMVLILWLHRLTGEIE